jgi:Tfp pilus assembly protein PilF
MWRARSILLPAFLIMLTAVAYFPALGSGYIWDDDFYVTNNRNLHSVDGLRSIWFEPRSLPQYYPLVHSTFWLEYQLWGLWAAGYHLVNILLHAMNATLLWQALKRLKIPGAVFAGFLFALHPVHVESVAWITERKNVLSLLFYLLALLSYLRFARLEDSRSHLRLEWRYYGLSLVFFVCALFSKTVTCTLPAALLLITWWKKGQLRRRDIAPVVPMLLIGLALAWMTIWLEKTHVGARGVDWSLNFVERCLIAGRALWFYAGKLIWPVNLTFIYPRWVIDATVWWQYIYPSASLIVVGAAYLLKPRIGRGPLAAIFFFAGSLLPALGFFDIFPMLYSFVADHFQYLASIGLIVGFASSATLLSQRIWNSSKVSALWIAAGIPVLALGILTFRQSLVYRHAETLWRDTLSKNPSCWMAYDNLGVVCAQQGKLDEAVIHYREALRIRPKDATILHDFGTALARQGKHAEAIEQLRAALELRPVFYEARYNLGMALFSQHRYLEAAEQLKEAIRLKDDDAESHYTLAQALSNIGSPGQAAEHYRQAILLKPGWAAAVNDLAWLLATSEDSKVRSGSEAVRLARQACDAAQYHDINYLDTLAAACAEAGDYKEAVRIGRLALDLARSSTLDKSVLEEYQKRLNGYQQNVPYRDRKSLSYD